MQILTHKTCDECGNGPVTCMQIDSIEGSVWLCLACLDAAVEALREGEECPKS